MWGVLFFFIVYNICFLFVIIKPEHITRRYNTEAKPKIVISLIGVNFLDCNLKQYTIFAQKVPKKAVFPEMCLCGIVHLTEVITTSIRLRKDRDIPRKSKSAHYCWGYVLHQQQPIRFLFKMKTFPLSAFKPGKL